GHLPQCRVKPIEYCMACLGALSKTFYAEPYYLGSVNRSDQEGRAARFSQQGFAPAGRSASSAEIGYAVEPSVGQIRGILRPPNLPRRISKLCKEIDERVHAFLDRPLAGKWPHLWLDAKSRRSSIGPPPRKSCSHQTR